jgi:hypothetical protein
MVVVNRQANWYPLQFHLARRKYAIFHECCCEAPKKTTISLSDIANRQGKSLFWN